MRYLLLGGIVSIIWAKLVPAPLFTDPHPMQRIGWCETMEHLGINLFAQSNGISFVKLRDGFPETWLGVVADQTWDRLIYILGVDSLSIRYARFFKAFGYWAPPSYFRSPRGLACDSTVFNNNSNNYFVYTADYYNNRIVRAYYNTADKEIHFYDNIFEGTLLNPEDVACVLNPSGGSYMIVADTKHHRILLIQIAVNLSYSILMTYGSEGSGVGQFRNPTSVAVVPCRDSIGYYRIYVVDRDNFRIVSLLYVSASNSITWEREFKDNALQAGFQSATSNPYYCVYVTDLDREKIWVFTPGLTELLYT